MTDHSTRRFETNVARLNHVADRTREGWTARAIADELGISIFTVGAYRRRAREGWQPALPSKRQSNSPGATKRRTYRSKPPDPALHGRPTNWMRGCRCKECEEWYTQRFSRKLRRGRPPKVEAATQDAAPTDALTGARDAGGGISRARAARPNGSRR